MRIDLDEADVRHIAMAYDAAAPGTDTPWGRVGQAFCDHLDAVKARAYRAAFISKNFQGNDK